MDFSIIERAGLTQKEFADLGEVSRVTVNLWTSGKMNPHRYIKGGISELLGILNVAVDKGALPLGNDVPRPKRAEHLGKIVADARTVQAA
jgi:transcriptional regulator with XRE-family HTH domain